MSVHEKIKEKYVGRKSREACVGQVLALNRPKPDALLKQVPPKFTTLSGTLQGYSTAVEKMNETVGNYPIYAIL